jgi:hypothetical protein
MLTDQELTAFANVCATQAVIQNALAERMFKHELVKQANSFLNFLQSPGSANGVSDAIGGGNATALRNALGGALVGGVYNTLTGDEEESMGSRFLTGAGYGGALTGLGTVAANHFSNYMEPPADEKARTAAAAAAAAKAEAQRQKMQGVSGVGIKDRLAYTGNVLESKVRTIKDWVNDLLPEDVKQIRDTWMPLSAERTGAEAIGGAIAGKLAKNKILDWRVETEMNNRRAAIAAAATATRPPKTLPDVGPDAPNKIRTGLEADLGTGTINRGIKRLPWLAGAAIPFLDNFRTPLPPVPQPK